MTDLTNVPEQDLLGVPLNARERELCEIYVKLKQLAGADARPLALLWLLVVLDPELPAEVQHMMSPTNEAVSMAFWSAFNRLLLPL